MKTRSKGGWERTSLSPAKVNLLLKVVSKRPDGYHNLVSIVDLVSLYDTMRIRILPEGGVTVRDSSGLLPDGPDNTVYRAIMLLKEHYGMTSGVEVHIEKRIPMGAGLGGGSSDAATVMKALVGLWNLPMNPRELMGLGARIGADVPLFIFGASCVIRGIGERVSPLHLPTLWYVIVYPNVAIATKDVYRDLGNLLTKGENEVRFSEDFSTPRDVANILENDLEEVALLKCPEIKTIKERLKKAGAVGSLMSGSGSAVFGIFEDEKEAREGSTKVGDLGSVFAVKSV